MDGRNCSVKTSLYIKEWMVQADNTKGANMVKKKMNDRLLLLSSNIITLYFKYGRSKWCFEKNIFSLQKSDASNRSS